MKNKIKTFFGQLIAMRKELIKQNKSKKAVEACNNSIGKLQLWLSTYPNASDISCCHYFINNKQEIKYLLPGEKCKSYATWQEKYDKIDTQSVLFIRNFKIKEEIILNYQIAKKALQLVMPEHFDMLLILKTKDSNSSFVKGQVNPNWGEVEKLIDEGGENKLFITKPL